MSLAKGVGIYPPPPPQNLQVMCDGKPERFDYVMSCFALPLQRPGTKLGTMLIFQGGQGCGKSAILAGLLGRGIYGATFIEINDIRQLLGNFNAHLAGMLFMVCDEAMMGGLKVAEEGKLKNTITAPQSVLERKGKDCGDMHNFLNIVAPTNLWKCIKLDPDDRRFFLSQCSNQYVGNKEVFDKLWDNIKDPKFCELLYLLLMTLDLEGFDPWTSMPITEMKVSLQMDQRPHLVCFLQHVAQHPRELGLKEGESVIVNKAFFYEVYVAYAAKDFAGTTLINGHNFIKDVSKVLEVKLVKTTKAHGAKDKTAYWFPSYTEVKSTLQAGNLWDEEQP